MTGLLQDVRYSLRSFAKSPGFVVVAVMTLGLGIGANTALFSVVNRYLINPLPFADAGRIVSLHNEFGSIGLLAATSVPVAPRNMWSDNTRQTGASLSASKAASAVLTPMTL